MDALPPELRQEVLMSGSALDGQVITTHRFRSDRKPAVLLAGLRERWRDEGLAVVESRQGDWIIVSMRDAEGMQTVQLRETVAGTEGLSSRWHRRGDRGAAPDAARAASQPPVLDWLPGDARVVRRLTHLDGTRSAGTVVALVSEPPLRAARQLRDRARGAGFGDEVMPAAADATAGPAAAGQAIAFRRGAQEVVATVAPHRDGTAVVMHWSAPR